MDDEGQRPPGTIGALWAAPEKKLGAEPKQLDLWPVAQSAAVGSEEEGAAFVDEGAPTRACDQRSKFLPMIVAPAASARDHDIRAPRRDEFTLAAASAGAPKTDRQAMAGAAAKAADPGASGLTRGHERSRSPQLANAVANKDPLTSNSIAPAAARPAAVPETRPTTIEGWTIREVAGGTVVLDGPSGAWRAAQGDTVPGVGRIDSIVRWGSRWIIATTKGLISTQD